MTEMPRPHPAPQRGAILKPETHWRAERADRLTVIIDAADYFRHLRDALSRAERAIYLIGWDFDLRLEMLPGESDADGLAPDGLPNALGAFLERIVERTPELALHILKWDEAMLMQVAQQARETLSLKLASERIQFALDSHHPVGATHHQKIVVIDDRLAFCGGIDVTGGRWDTRDHAPEDPLRMLPDGTPHKPWHDVTTALTGPVAVALGDLARMRWEAATGEALEPPRTTALPWPDGLEVGLEGARVAIARTQPEYHEQDLINEIEELYLSAILHARETIYLESQYFASGSICEALELRLSEPDGPELVVLNPEEAEGVLGHAMMDTARARVIERLRAVAGPDRFRIYHPANAAGRAIYVHAKVLIVDDRLVRIGSSNVNNRSTGFDTECDVAFETHTDAERAFALALRHDLLAEHLGCEAADVAREVAARGSLIAAVDALNGRADRRLVPIEPGALTAFRREAGERLLTDERTHPRNRPHGKRHVTHAAKRAMAPYHLEIGAPGAVLLAVATVGLAIWGATRLARREREPLAAPAVVTGDRSAPPPAPPIVRPDGPGAGLARDV